MIWFMGSLLDDLLSRGEVMEGWLLLAVMVMFIVGTLWLIGPD